MPSPWVTRAQRDELPANDYTGRLAVYARNGMGDLVAIDREALALRFDFAGRAYSVADLQRAVAREDAGR